MAKSKAVMTDSEKAADEILGLPNLHGPLTDNWDVNVEELLAWRIQIHRDIAAIIDKHLC